MVLCKSGDRFQEKCFDVFHEVFHRGRERGRGPIRMLKVTNECMKTFGV